MRELEHYNINKMLRKGSLKPRVTICSSCGGEIFLGEEYVTDGFYSFHTDCLFKREAKRP